MNLNWADIDHFYKLFLGLMLFVNKDKKILEHELDVEESHIASGTQVEWNRIHHA